jgi:hypothetical protein
MSTYPNSSIQNTLAETVTVCDAFNDNPGDASLAAVIAGPRSFAAIGQWATDARPEALAVLGAARGPAEESTFGRAFAMVSADVPDRVPGAWLYTRAVPQAAGC